MRFIFSLGICSFLLVACAGRTYEVDRRDSRYQAGEMGGAPPMSTDRSAGTDSAIWGAAISGAMLAANPGYYDGSLLRGKLVCGPEKTPALEIACAGIEVSLRDTKGKELGRTRSENGDFAFKVDKKVTYRLAIVSERYAPITPLKSSYQQGDSVILRLKKK